MQFPKRRHQNAALLPASRNRHMWFQKYHRTRSFSPPPQRSGAASDPMSPAQIPDAAAGEIDAEDHSPHAPSLLDFMPRQLQTKKKRRTKADAKEPDKDGPHSACVAKIIDAFQPELPAKAVEASQVQVRAGGLKEAGVQEEAPSWGPVTSEPLAAVLTGAPVTADAAALADPVTDQAEAAAEAEVALSGQVASAQPVPAHANLVLAQPYEGRAASVQPKVARLPHRSYMEAMGLSTTTKPPPVASSPAGDSSISADIQLLGAHAGLNGASGSPNTLQNSEAGKGTQSVGAMQSVPLAGPNHIVVVSAPHPSELNSCNDSETTGKVSRHEPYVEPSDEAAVASFGDAAPTSDGRGWVGGLGQGSTHHLGHLQQFQATPLHAAPAADPWGAHLGGLLSEVRERPSSAAASDTEAALHLSMHAQMPLPGLPGSSARSVDSHDANSPLPRGAGSFSGHEPWQPSPDDLRQGSAPVTSLPNTESGSHPLHGAWQKQEGLSPRQNNGRHQHDGLERQHDSLQRQHDSPEDKRTTAKHQQGSSRVYPESRLPWRGAALRLASCPTDPGASSEQPQLPASVQHALAQTQMRPPARPQSAEPAQLAPSFHGPLPSRLHPASSFVGRNSPEHPSSSGFSGTLSHFSSPSQRIIPSPMYSRPSAAFGPPSKLSGPPASVPLSGGMARLPHHQQVPQLTFLGPSPANPASINYVLQRMGAQVQGTNGSADAQRPPQHALDRQGPAHPPLPPRSSSRSSPPWHQASSPSAQIRDLEASRYQQVAPIHTNGSLPQRPNIHSGNMNCGGPPLRHAGWQSQQHRQQQTEWQGSHANGDMCHSASGWPGLSHQQPHPPWQAGHAMSNMAPSRAATAEGPRAWQQQVADYKQDGHAMSGLAPSQAATSEGAHKWQQQPADYKQGGHAMSGMALSQAATSDGAHTWQQHTADNRPGMPRPVLPAAAKNQQRLQQLDQAAVRQMQPVSHLDLSSQDAALHAMQGHDHSRSPSQVFSLGGTQSQGSDAIQSSAVQLNRSPASQVRPAMHSGGTVPFSWPGFAAQSTSMAPSLAAEQGPNEPSNPRSSAGHPSAVMHAASTNSRGQGHSPAFSRPAVPSIVSREMSPFEPHASAEPHAGAKSTTQRHLGLQVRVNVQHIKPESQVYQSSGSFSMAAFFPPALSPAKTSPHRHPDHS